MSRRTRDGPNVAASVRQLLLNLARNQHSDFRLMLERYGAERFLYRLGASDESECYVLKGAMLFQLWTEQEFRSTRDVDVLAFGATDHGSIRRSIETICAVQCPEDGLRFDLSMVRIVDIRHAQEYGGVL